MNPRTELRTFLQGDRPDPVVFSDGDDLIEKGILDSLRFREFIHLIEALSGMAIDVENLNIDDFRSIDRIVTTFFPATDPHREHVTSSSLSHF
ncbi:hypothetical protein [uncultured Bradyrhizobium sp.]|uniref:hypothetical protein n=1 Tax=uncultured Bradyrhizobium sp. TaxID=199684 RepID=UPI0035C9D5FA